MKNKLIYTFMAIAGMATAGMMVSCNETYAEQDKGATPVIKYARTCNINEADSLVASARSELIFALSATISATCSKCGSTTRKQNSIRRWSQATPSSSIFPT